MFSVCLSVCVFFVYCALTWKYKLICIKQRFRWIQFWDDLAWGQVTLACFGDIVQRTDRQIFVFIYFLIFFIIHLFKAILRDQFAKTVAKFAQMLYVFAQFFFLQYTIQYRWHFELVLCIFGFKIMFLKYFARSL